VAARAEGGLTTVTPGDVVDPGGFIERTAAVVQRRMADNSFSVNGSFTLSMYLHALNMVTGQP
jgi:hypothetical protein